MPAIQQIALIVAVAVPVLVIAGINIYLMLLGERGTLLMPQLGRFPSIPLDAEPVAGVEVEEPGVAAAEDEMPLREAA